MTRNELNNTNVIGYRACGIYYGVIVNATIIAARPCYGQEMEYTLKTDQNVFPFHNYDDPRRELLVRCRDLADNFDILES